MGSGHSHDAGGATPRRRLVIAFAITASFFIIEVIGSILTGSLALLVDAAHMLTDLIGLAMATTAAQLMNRAPSNRHTWGCGAQRCWPPSHKPRCCWAWGSSPWSKVFAA